MSQGRPPKEIIKNGKCRYFKKGKDGCCIYYAGSRKNIESCYIRCLKRTSRD